MAYSDASVLLYFSVGDFRSADVYGYDVVLPSLSSFALGRVPKQVLQGRWL